MALRRSSSRDGRGGDLSLLGLGLGAGDGDVDGTAGESADEVAGEVAGQSADSPPVWVCRDLADEDSSESTESSSSDSDDGEPVFVGGGVRIARKELVAALRPVIDDALKPLYINFGQLQASWGEANEELCAVREKLNELVAEKRASPRQLTEGRVCAGVANSQLGLQKMDQLAKKITELQADHQQSSRKRSKVEADIESLYKGFGEVQGTLAVLSAQVRSLSADLNYALELDGPTEPGAPGSPSGSPSSTSGSPSSTSGSSSSTSGSPSAPA